MMFGVELWVFIMGGAFAEKGQGLGCEINNNLIILLGEAGCEFLDFCINLTLRVTVV